MRTHRTFALLAPLVLATLCACGASVTSSSSAPPAAPDGTAPTGTSPEGTTPLGGTATLSDGMQVSVSKAADYKPSQYAAGAIKGGNSMQFKVTIVNGTDEAYEPSLFSLSVSGGPNGSECESVFDSGKGMDGAPSTKVLPGKRATFPWAVSCPKDVAPGVELTVEASVGFLGENPIFSGKAA